jgi:bifunctional non-homologous end joining protein LigD
MQPALVSEPFHRPGWVYERKEDGWRMLAFKDGTRVRLVSRQGVDHTARFPDTATAVASLSGRKLILDGEVCVFDRQLISQFHLIADEQPPEEPRKPPVFIAFDLLHRGQRDLREQPLSFRRSVLEDTVAGSKLIFPALRLEEDGLAAWEQVKRGGWEGLVAKDESSRYIGGQTRSWLKVKVRHEARFAVIGLDVPLAGSCSLLLARREGRRLTYVGRVEWGVRRALIAATREQCTVRRTPACADVDDTRGIVWTNPSLTADVTFSELMLGRLRDPVLRGVRRNVTVEPQR